MAACLKMVLRGGARHILIDSIVSHWEEVESYLMEVS